MYFTNIVTSGRIASRIPLVIRVYSSSILLKPTAFPSLSIPIYKTPPSVFANANDDNAGTAVNDDASDGDTSAAENGDANGNDDAPTMYELGDGDWAIAPNKSVRHNGVYDSYIYGSEKMQDISIEIFKQAASSKKNSMISPISVIMAMGMVENGAAGDTKGQMEKVFGMDTEVMNEWIKEWSAAQESKSDDGKTKINITNAFWYNEAAGFKPNSDYKKLLKKSFDADIKGGNFDNSTVNQINK